MALNKGYEIHYDKYQVFSNIRYHLNKNPNVKIGQIEKAAGIRLGYMARLIKEDNNTEPSVKFICKAAQMLGVSVDQLIYSNIGLDNEYISSFLNKMIASTVNSKLLWEKCNKGKNDCCVSSNTVLQPIVIKSKTQNESLVTVNEYCRAKIAKNNYVYLFKIDDWIIEMWFFDKDGKGKYFLDNTYKDYSYLVNELYKLAKQQICIDRTLKNAIDNFMLNIEQEQKNG